MGWVPWYHKSSLIAKTVAFVSQTLSTAQIHLWRREHSSVSRLWSGGALTCNFACALSSELTKLCFIVSKGCPSPKGLNSDMLPYYQIHQLKMDNQYLNAIHGCHLCQLSDKISKLCPGQTVAIDIVGTSETATTYCRFVIALIDSNSKWPEVVIFMSAVFSRHGIHWA